MYGTREIGFPLRPNGEGVYKGSPTGTRHSSLEGNGESLRVLETERRSLMNPSQFSMELKKYSTWRRQSKKRNHTRWPNPSPDPDRNGRTIRKDLGKTIKIGNTMGEWVHGYTYWNRDDELVTVNGHPSGTAVYRNELHHSDMKRLNVRCRCR